MPMPSVGGSTAVKAKLMLVLPVLVIAILPAVGWCDWGWPPPGYSTTGVRACDGSHYRGLLEQWRDHRRARRCGNTSVSDISDFSAAPAVTVAVPQTLSPLPPPRSLDH
jgi:hypothetical protein